MIYLDCEASGLSDDSYPIEVAWLSTDAEGESLLINPETATGWSHWDPSAEDIHNIKRMDCVANGLHVIEVANRLNSQLRGEVVYTDAPAFDGFWLDRLFQAAGVERLFDVSNIDYYLYDNGFDFVKWRSVRSRITLKHRAMADCERAIEAGKKLKIW